MSDQLQQQAKQLWNKHRDVFKAAEELIFLANQEDFARLAEMGAQQMVRSVLTTDRKPGSEKTERLLPSEAGRIARQRWINQHMLFGGKISLAEATWKDAANSARAYWKQRDASDAMGKFHMAFAEVLKKTGKKGGEVFTDKTAKELMRKFRL